MSYHIECEKDEEWVGNTHLSLAQELKELPGVDLRLGRIAYDVHGNPIPEGYGIRPLIIKKSSVNRYDYLYGLALRAIRNGGAK